MVKKLSIRNYKSIEAIDLHVRRVNVFIGEHNSGKSNILEALTWFSVNALDEKNFSEVFRFRNATDFFYDFNTSLPIQIKTDDLCFLLRYAKAANGALLNQFEGVIYPASADVDRDPDFFHLMTNHPEGFFFVCISMGELSIYKGRLNLRFVHMHLRN
jgi:AAA15 family ATPase/GTPase